ncbi:MAG: efflux RND transporter periplasmic adaptor subunit [Alicyclobacillus sp.]|nr:efflux RND transporter periplasmic adaptor subunit [Alicyclobacillus sp.]
MKGKRWFIIKIVAACVIVVGAVVGVLVYSYLSRFVSTDDAYVDGQQVTIAAPAAGKIVNWRGVVGSTFAAGTTVGGVQASGSSTIVPIPMPTDGTIVELTAVNNEFVAPGTPLAYEYNLNDLWVTANVKETQLSEVRVGAPVDVSVDAYPGVKLHGQVVRIGLATASQFSLIPSRSTDANFTKVTQVVPVKIAISGYQTLGLVPGMSVSVRIHKQAQ